MKASVGNLRQTDFNDPKTVVLADILSERRLTAPKRLLVVGCGKGTEAAVLAQHLKTLVIGIDINLDFDTNAAAVVDLRQGDATQMEFQDESFDFVYSFHVLEHIPDHLAALREIRRVLKPGGGYMIGTPNRSRLIGYLGSRGATVLEKARWNIADWHAKLRGKFRNEDGAHAGFAQEELQAKLAHIFTRTENITTDYYLRVYHTRQFLVTTLCRTGLWRWLFPAIYFYGVR